MELYRVIYSCENVRMKTGPYMSLKDCLNEQKRFNSLPILDLERQAMTVSIESVEV